MNFTFTHMLFALPLYLDPGSGSLIIQLVVAALLGIGVAVRLFWSRIKLLFNGKKNLPTAESETRQDEQQRVE